MRSRIAGVSWTVTVRSFGCVVTEPLSLSSGPTRSATSPGSRNLIVNSRTPTGEAAGAEEEGRGGSGAREVLAPPAGRPEAPVDAPPPQAAAAATVPPQSPAARARTPT